MWGMGVNIIGLVADWEPTVAAYRETGTDFYFDLDEDEELPFAEEDYLPGFKRFLNTADFYLKIQAELAASDRERLEPFLRWVSAFDLDGKWRSGTDPADDLRADAGGRADGSVLFAMRPAKVLDALALAERLPWRAIEAACGRVDLSDAAGDIWRIEGYGDFEWILTTYIDWMKEAAAAGRGLVVLVSI